MDTTRICPTCQTQDQATTCPVCGDPTLDLHDIAAAVRMASVRLAALLELGLKLPPTSHPDDQIDATIAYITADELEAIIQHLHDDPPECINQAGIERAFCPWAHSLARGNLISASTCAYRNGDRCALTKLHHPCLWVDPAAPEWGIIAASVSLEPAAE